jgi:hypothetical protein
MRGNEFGETGEMSISLEEEEIYYNVGFEDGTGTLKTLVAERDEARKHEAAAYERQLELQAENTRMRALIQFSCRANPVL